MLSAASRAGSRAAAYLTIKIGSATLLLACACSRAPGPPADVAREDKAGASTPLTVADAHLARGEEARERGEYARANEELQKARDLFEKDQNWEGYVRARNLIGAVSARRGDYKGALEHLNAALATAQEKLGPNHSEVARSYQEIGKVYVSTGQSAEALELLGKALTLRRAAGSEPAEEVAEILLRMAFARTSQGEDDQALALLDEAEVLQRKARVRVQPRLADILIGKGSALWGQGKYDSAITAFEQAIAMLEAEGGAHRASLAAAYLNLANAYWSKSDYDEALTFYGKALPLQTAALGEAHPDVGTAHMNLAILHLMKGDNDAGIASAEKALRILVPALGERNALVVQTYNAMGSAYTRKGDSDRALAVLEKARALQLSLSEKGDRNSAVIYSSLGDAYRAKGDFARAVRHYRQALAVDLSIYGERHPDVAEDFANLGELYLEKGDENEALRFFAKAIAANAPQPVGADPDLDPPFDTAFSEEFLLKALKGAARARARRAAKRAHRRDFESASFAYEQASRLIDRMRAGYRAEGSKLSLAASATETYDEAIRTELDLHRLTGEERHREAAFRYAEKSKAGVLRDALNEAEARSFAGIPGALLEKERQLRVDLAAADSRLTEAQMEPGADERQLSPLREKQFALQREYEALQQRFEKEYPDYYDLKYRFETVGPVEVRQSALDEGTVLVEYFLGRERVFIFTLTAHELEVTSVAREASFEPELRELRRAISTQDLTSYAQSAHRLYRLLLAPVEGRLEGKDLVIVPDGPLSAVPFEALLEREASPYPGDARQMPYVLRDHAISYAYSATVLLQGLRRRRASPPDEFVGFAPGFAEQAASAEVPRPLPASRKEVTAVRGLFAKRQGFFGGWFSGRSRVYLGRDATEGRLKSAGLERYRYVHLATHGVVDEEHPSLSRLLLGPESRSGEDGVLYLGEVYNLRLNADLVVLSACDTGGGRIARGEGIIGLTRGFLYAGASSLLVSLWPVSDAAAEGLVVDFYAGLLRGQPKAQALREAKLRTMGRNPEYAKPFYWASLVLVGNRR
jgi:CHAT domain-containing protein/lipopolysaccharide biosynthesis regulator YciM